MKILSRTFQLFATLLLLLLLSGPCGAQDKRKISYALFLDNSGSMRTQFAQLIKLGKAVTRQIHERGPVSVFDFTTQGALQDATTVAIPRLERSQDEMLLEQAIDGIYVVGGQTMLLDAIQTIAESFGPRESEGVASERVIILITDGEDRKSHMTEATLIQKLKGTRTKVYAIGMVGQLPSPSRASDLLRKVTNETGGRVVFTKSDPDDLQRLLAELAIAVP